MTEGTEATLAGWRREIDAALASVPIGDGLPARVREAIHYSLIGGGKRLRGLLVLGAYQAVGGRGDAVPLATAVEIVHAYSLVHDDLPCMDDDSMRRGRPTTHRAFDTPLATIVGVVMVPLAVRQTLRAARCLGVEDATATRLVNVLMQASGASGMVGGQVLDLDGEGRSLSVGELERIHAAKTGALIAGSLAMGGIAGGGSEPVIAALSSAGAALGLAFQIADDVLDATGSSALLGKTAGRDATLAKSTYASVIGVSVSRRTGESLVRNALAHLSEAGIETPVLRQLAHFVSVRGS